MLPTLLEEQTQCKPNAAFEELWWHRIRRTSSASRSSSSPHPKHTGSYLLDVGHVYAQLAQLLHIQRLLPAAPFIGQSNDGIENWTREHNGQNKVRPNVQLEGTHDGQSLVEATWRMGGKGARVGKCKEGELDGLAALPAESNVA